MFGSLLLSGQGKRTSPSYKELLDVVTRAVDKLGLEWECELAQTQTQSKLADRYLTSHTSWFLIFCKALDGLESVSEKFLTLKTVLLVALCSLKRIGDLQAFFYQHFLYGLWSCLNHFHHRLYHFLSCFSRLLYCKPLIELVFLVRRA